MRSNAPSGGMKLMVRSFSKRAWRRAGAGGRGAEGGVGGEEGGGARRRGLAALRDSRGCPF
jgi:hypothetical protein